MQKTLGRWLKVQPEEMSAFLWSALLLFLIRNSNIIFNNFAETAFLKRFGVEYLPLVYVANSFCTFFIMGFMAGVMKRLESARLLTYQLLIFGFLVAGLRIVVGLDFELIYPVLFLLKAQFEGLLALVFWNLANDLFNTRQSKRIFPLITAGGVIGAIVGSFGTPFIAKAVQINNLMLVYLCTTSLGAMVVWRMSVMFQALPLSERKARKKAKRPSIIKEIKQVIPLIKESTLVKILILITFLPNVVIPIMNYQFNFAVNEAFATEGGMVAFFGYFRGVLNIVSLVILLFVGKLYSRWGLPIALMFHPINYVIAFLALLFNFNYYSAMYARLSTRVIRMTINNPARDILMGLFPPEYRPMLRPFLRGTVVRLGLLLGSGFIMLFENALHPKYLSCVGVAFGSMWIISNIWLKRAYSSILLDLISKNVLDLKSLAEKDLGRIFKSQRAQERLVESCHNSEAPACVWYAEMLRTHEVPQWVEHLLSMIKKRDDKTVAALLPLLPSEAAPRAVEVFSELLPNASPELTLALTRTASAWPHQVTGGFLSAVAQKADDLQTRAWAIGGLYSQDRDANQGVISAWLGSDDPQGLRAGVIAAGSSGDAGFLPVLRGLLEGGAAPELIPDILSALSRLKDPQLIPTVLELLHKSPDLVPVQVLNSMEAVDYETTEAFIRLLGGDSPERRSLAKEKLQHSQDLDLDQLIQALALPNRRIRKNLFSIFEHLKISQRDIISFARGQLESAYINLEEARAAKRLPAGPVRDLLAEHLAEKKDVRLDNVLRVLATQDDSDRMRIVQRGLHSADARLRSNAIEAVESLVGSRLAGVMMPLLEEVNPGDALNAGRKLFTMPTGLKSADEVLRYFLAKRDWVTLSLALNIAAGQQGFELSHEQAEHLGGSESPVVRAMAAGLTGPANKERQMEESVSLPDKIILLRQMEIFEGLSVNELGAVAAVCQEEVHAPGDKIIIEGEVGETMYLVVSGRVEVSKIGEDGCGMALGHMTDGEYFGEMALFDDQARSATVAAEEQTRLLVLHKREFAETVREYPQVALQICKEMSRRVRELHQRIQTLPVCDVDPPQA